MFDLTMTKKEAFARRTGLLKDTGWIARYLARGATERRELRHLNAVVAGGRAPIESSREEAEARRKELLRDPAWRQLYMDGYTTARAEMASLHAETAAETEE